MVPEPNFWSYLVFESPWPVVLGLVGVWAVLRLVGARQQKRGLSLAAVGALVVAVLWRG